MSQLPAPTSDTPTAPDALASAVLRRHGLLPGGASSAGRAPLPVGHAGLVAADLGRRIQRSVSGTGTPPLRLGAIATDMAFPTAAVLQRTATTISARYSIQREPAPAEGTGSGDLPLTYPYGNLPESAAEETEAAPAPQPGLTFSDMLARVRGEAKPPPEVQRAPQEEVAPRTPPTATFADMLALVGRKQAAPPQQGAPAATPGTRGSSGPPPAQPGATTIRRRAQVEEVTPRPPSSPAAAAPAASTAAAPPPAEKPTAEEGDEEPWSPPPRAPAAADRPVAAIQRVAQPRPSRPAQRRSSIDEAPSAIEVGRAAETIGVERRTEPEAQDVGAGPEQPFREAMAAEPPPQSESLQPEIKTAAPAAPAAPVIQRKPEGPGEELSPPLRRAQGALPARQPVADLQRDMDSAASVSPQPTRPVLPPEESHPEPQRAEEAAPLAPLPAAEEIGPVRPAVAPAQPVSAAATEPTSPTGPALLQRQPAATEMPPGPTKEEAPAPGAAEPLPLVERPAPVQRQPLAEEAAYLEPPTQAAEAAPSLTAEPALPGAASSPLPGAPAPIQRGLSPSAPPVPPEPTAPRRRGELPLVEHPVERAPEPPRPAEAVMPEPSAPGIAQRKAAPITVPQEAGESPPPLPTAAVLPPASPEESVETHPPERSAEVAPPEPQTVAGPKAPLVQRTAELPLVTPAVPPPAVLGAEPQIETEAPPAAPSAPSLSEAVQARASAQAHLPVSAAAPEGLLPIPPAPVQPAIISRKESGTLGVEAPASPAEERRAMAWEVQAASPADLSGQAQPGLQQAAEGDLGQAVPEAPNLISPPPESAWAPVLPQARAILQRAQLQPAAAESDLPLVPPPAVVVVNRRPAGEAQREPEAERAEPEPPTGSAPSPAPVAIQRMPSVSEVESEAVVQRATELQSTGGWATRDEEPPAPKQDLDKMARDLLPLIKRMLAVERERRPRRW